MSVKSIDEAYDELRILNNNLSLIKGKKRSIVKFIEEENDRIKKIASNKSKAYELKTDKDFIANHGRERTYKEISLLMNYSERQVRRFLEEKD